MQGLTAMPTFPASITLEGRAMEWHWLRAWTVLACPDCPTSQVVRGAVLGEGFWGYLAMAGVPFLLIGALSALLYRVGLPPRELKP
jgi:hypothetical protein